MSLLSLKDTERERLSGYHLWGHKTVGACIGRGSFGQVYTLTDETAKTEDVLKVVTIEYTAEAEKEEPDKQKYLLSGLRSTLDEVQRMMELKDLPNFVSIYGYENYPIREGEELVGYDILIWMEKLTVLPEYLAQRKKQGKPVSELDIIGLGIQVCTGLEQANQKLTRGSHTEAEFIHRDIKPGNIFVSPDGTYKLGDLGIATMNQRKQYTMIGTPKYMAPEMFRDSGYRANVDLFALGKTLESLTQGMNLLSGLDQVIGCAEQTEPEDRYQTAQEMKLDLEQCARRLTHANPEGEQTLPVGRQTQRYGQETERFTERMTRNLKQGERVHDDAPEQRVPASGKRTWGKLLLAAAAVVVVCLAAAGGFKLWQDQQAAAQKQAQNAEIQAEVDRYLAKENYSEAILCLQDVLEQDPEEAQWQELLTQCQDEYRDSILEQAEEVYQKKGNTKAAETVQEGLVLLPDDEMLLRYARAYEESAPKHLYELTPTDSNVADGYYVDSTAVDSEGNTYEGYFCLRSWGGWQGIGAHSAYCTFALDGAYQWFEAKVFVDPLTQEDDEIRFQVLADGLVIYDSGVMRRPNQPKEIRLDVTDVQELTIQSESEDYSLFGTKPSVLVTDAVLKQKITVE